MAIMVLKVMVKFVIKTFKDTNAIKAIKSIKAIKAIQVMVKLKGQG